MTKRITAVLLALAMILALVGCGQRGKVIFASPGITVTQMGRNRAVVVNESGEVYRFTTGRVKRPQGDAESAQSMVPAVVVDNDTVRVSVVFSTLIITEKDTGATVVLP